MLDASEILNASILVVDDMEANVMLLEQMLRNAGYANITTTQNPRQVVGLHSTHRYDLILLDLQMPEMDGFEVIEALKTIDNESYLPVLVITAQPGHKLRALKAGAKDFVSKPFDLVEVQTRIHNMLEVRLLYRKLDNYNKVLEQTVLERTAELRESEARFQRFTELSSDWYWEQDAAGKLIKHSGPVIEMLGIGAEPGSGNWNASERALLDANIASRRPFLDLVYSRGLADGSTQYLQVSGEPMFDSSSRFKGYRGIGMDVTERMKPLSGERRFRTAVDAIGQGVCLIDRATMRVVDANETACRLSGYTREELGELELSALDIGSEGDLAGVFDRLIADGTAHGHSSRLKHKDGVHRDTHIEWRAVRVDNWMLVGVINETKAITA